MRINAVPAAAALAAVAAAALLAERASSVAVLGAIVLAVCVRAPRGPRRLYLLASLVPGIGVLVISPFLAVEGGELLWEGPSVPVIGRLDVTTDELAAAAVSGLRLSTVALAFAAYALFLDHDRLVAAAGFARRSSLAVALATRLVPTLERDAAGLADAIRGRGVAVAGVRGHARLLSPLVAGSLERASQLAEAMEARGYGRPGATRAPGPPPTRVDRAALLAAPVLVVAAALWL